MADQDFEKLLGTIKSLNREIETLKKKIQEVQTSAKSLTVPEDVTSANRSIGGYKSAITRKSSQVTQLASQGLKDIRSNKDLAGSISGIDLERRLNLISLGVPLTTSEINSRARSIAQSVLAQQKKVLQDAQKSAVSGQTSAISHPVPTLEELDRRVVEYNSRVGKQSSAPKLTEKQRVEEESLRSARAKIQAETKYSKLLEQAATRGFGPEHLKRVQSRGTSGIEQFQFERLDAGGVQQRGDYFVSPNGRTTPGISNQFRSFGQGVARDIGELTKWSLALAVVYTPMQKLSELTQQMIENQTKLADASITVASAFLDQGQIFDIAADSADRAGEAVTGVIDAFTLAYRAAGGGADEVERLATAQKLLDDSLILSKLSSLDQAEAIDTLSAALRQSYGELDKGTTLLDKWVRVTQVANVDMASLATGFAVVGDAAEAAGVDADKLNGILAAVAETGVASGKELANTTRALIAGFQSEQAQKELESIGVSVRTTSGELRPFLDLMQELYNLRQTGALSDSQFSKLTLALGGGTRRQAAYATFIENFDRVFEVANQSAAAGGQSEQALEKQLATVQTSLTELDNAFDSLAQTMGQEGGFLSIIQGSIEGTTLLVKAFDGLVGALGKATPALAAFLATAAILRYKGSGSPQTALSTFAQGLTTAQPQYQLESAPLTGRQKFGNFAATNLLGTNAASGAFQGIAASLIPALLNATNKEDKFGGLKAGANVVGGITGGIVGALTGPQGALIGAAIGTAIADVFITKTVAYEADLFKYSNAPTLLEKGTGAEQATPGSLEAVEQAQTNLYKSVGFGNEALGRFLSGSGGPETEFIDQINEAIESGNEKAFNKLLNVNSTNTRLFGAKTRLEEGGIDEDFLRKAFAQGQQIEFSPENLVYQRATDEARRAYDEARAAYEASSQESVDVSTPFSEAVLANRQAFAPVIEQIRQESLDRISGERLSGDLKGTQYTQQVKSVQGFDTKALQYYTALGDQFIDLNRDVNDTTEAFQAFSDVVIYGSQESVAELTSIVAEIQTLQNLLNSPELAKTKTVEFQGQNLTREDLEKRLSFAQETGANLTTDIYNQARLSRLQIPDVQGDVKNPLSTQDFQLVLQEAASLQDQFYQGFLKLPDEMYEGLKKSWDDWAQIIEDSGEVFFETVSGFDPQFFQQAMAKLLEENKLKSQAANPFGIQQVDLPGSRAGELQSTVDYFSQYLATNFPQYEQKPEDIGIIFNDYVTSTLHGDNLAIKLALEKLVDLNQKQLDGQYNIPEGATFWVPLTAAYYRNKGGDGAGGLGDLDTSSLDTSATNLDGSATALNNAADGIAAAFEKDDELTRELIASLKEPLHDNKESEAFRAKNDPEGYKTPTLDETLNRKSEETGPSAQTGSFVEKLLAALNSAFPSASQSVGNKYGQGNLGANSTPGFTGGREQQQQVNTAPVSKLDLKIAATTTLTLDGRILASALQNYLAQDLLRTEASQGTITKRYVI